MERAAFTATRPESALGEDKRMSRRAKHSVRKRERKMAMAMASDWVWVLESAAAE